jgi:protein-tyrosine phosphatase
MDGYPAHPEATRLMDERGLDITGHRSRQVTPDMALAADLILVMDQEEKAWCERLAPSTVGRVFLLGHWLPPGQREIPDPIQRDAAFFRSTLDRMLQALAAWHDHLHLSPEPE